uniref:Chromo domain-containing protein n=1 Tax=Panagrolaimus davidi TaxID=227884 RepID=A0A914R469_9BILA
MGPKKSSKNPMKYEVEKIIDQCKSGTELQYLIKWKGFGDSENTWESAKSCDCPDLIKEFEEEQKLKDSRGKRVSQNCGPRAKRSRTAASASNVSFSRSQSIRNTKLKGPEQKFVDDNDPLFDHSSFNPVAVDNKIETDKPRKITLNDYVERAAEIPPLQDYPDRDECISASENYKLLTDSQMEHYISACEAKFQGDTHNALEHLSANGYSIEKALETIDNPDSSPMKYLNKNLGIWTKDELKKFARLMLAIYVQKDKKIQKQPLWLEKISEKFRYKSRKNCLNLYYTLKSAGFSFKNGAFNKTSKFSFKSSTNECPNCIKKLWKLKNQQNEANLCGLCKLYFKLCGKHRPNANAFSHPSGGHVEIGLSCRTYRRSWNTSLSKKDKLREQETLGERMPPKKKTAVADKECYNMSAAASIVSKNDNDYFAYIRSVNDRLRVTIYGCQSGKFILQNEFTNINKFIANVSKIFDSKIKAIILQVFNFTNKKYPNNIHFCEALKAKLDACKIPYYFISDANMLFASILTTANVSGENVTVINSHFGIAVKLEYTENGYKIGELFPNAEALVNSNDIKKVLVSTDKNQQRFMKMFKSKNPILIDEGSLDNFTKALTEVKKWMLDKTYMKFHVIPMTAREYHIGYEFGKESHTFLMVENDLVLPFEETIECPKASFNYFVCFLFVF